ncbi:MAG: AAA family ATPase [Piscinibacter sp.]|uniref:ATP-binding protein n=1 Tax=Piscinibacter sp. TaxID=1903157 RepID=UPI001B565954|nr:BTAD domain-containing putative transcriptional regulator [Piscinibacter sp.]MBP5991151.1 AAA family ATPase [Piscinibacter sp.]MBP6028363.1 AAA family ATPase [Piscinibacter sp.]
MDGLLELALLGRPRVAVGGTPVAVPTRKSLALVAFLAIAGPAARSTLAELLWSGQPVDASRRNLRQELHRLQKTALSNWIVVDAETLALREGFVLDVASWRDELAGGAIRSPPSMLLDGFDLPGAEAFADWLRVERQRLQGLWRQAAQQTAAAHERNGDLGAALQQLQQAIAADATDEPAHRDAMRLLHLMGRGDDALQLFARLRQCLRDDLGVEPDAGTHEMVRRIRSASPAGVPVAGPLSRELRSPLVGREAAWQQLAASAPGLVLIEGDAGVGKSRLAIDFAGAQGRVLVAKGREVSRETPLFPVAEALLRAYQDDSGWFDLLDPVWRSEVARLLPALGDGEPTRMELPLAEARTRFLDGLAAALLTAAGAGSIVFDDVQWFDASSAELMTYLAQRPHRARLLATARADELAANLPVRAALEAVARDGALQRVALAPLSAVEVRTLVCAMSGGRDAAIFSQRLHAATAGNPLFILESLRDLFAAGVLWREGASWATPFDADTEDYRELPISASVRDAVLRRIDRLGEPARRMLEVACLAGDGFRLDWLIACTDAAEADLVDAADAALQADLIAAAGEGYRFAHDLIRRSLDDALGTERRKLLHRRLAEAMVLTGAPAAEVATHLEAGQRSELAVTHRVRAAEAAARVYAQREALRQYELALADGAGDAAAFDIHAARIELMRNLGDDAGRSAALAAMAELVDCDDAARQVELAVKQAVDHFEHDRFDAAWRTACNAIERLSGRIDTLAEAALLLESGAALKGLGRIDEAEAALSAALVRYRGISALKTANCAYWLCQCAIERGDFARAQALCDESIAATAAAGHRRGHALSLSTRAELAFRAGDLAAGLTALRQAHAEAREIDSLPLQRAFAQMLAERLAGAGAHDEAATWRTELDRLRSG